MHQDRRQFDETVRRGSRWALATHLVGQILTAGALIALCRFVAPGQFGVFSTALLIVTLPRTFATIGFGTAIVQRTQIDDSQLSALFRLNLATSVACGVASGVLGEAIAYWKETPLLGQLTVVLAGTSLLSALGSTHLALLERRLALPLVQRARLAAQILGAGAGVGAAIAGAQAWALVVQQYVELALLALLAWRAEPWRPGFSRGGESARGLVRFGGQISLTNLLFQASQNFDKFLLYLTQAGTESGQAALGAYSLAFNWMMKPVLLLTTPAASVMLPALSRAADDRPLHAQLTQRFLRSLAIVLFPAGVGLFVVAADAARVVAGESWTLVGESLRALAPVVVVQGLINVCGPLLSSTGRTGRLLAGAGVVSFILVQGVAGGYWLGNLFGAAPDGPTLGVAWGYSLTTVILFVPYLSFVLLQLGLSPTAVLAPLIRPALAALAMGVVVVLGQRAGLADERLPAMARLLLQMSLGAASYAWLARGEVRWLWGEMKSAECGVRSAE